MENTNKDMMEALQYVMENMATKDELRVLESRFDAMESRVNATIDHKITKRLDALTDDYKTVYEKQWELERQNEQVMALLQDLQSRVSVLESKVM